MSSINKELDLLNGSSYTRTVLLGSYMTFLRTFFEIRTGREFQLSAPTARESHFITIAKALKRVFNRETKRLIINVPPRYGKAIDVDSQILTSQGWKRAKYIKEGDYIVGSNGYTKVIGVHPQGVLESWKVEFSDTSTVVCNPEHKWTIKNSKDKDWSVKTTAQLMRDLVGKYHIKKCEIPITSGNFGGIPFDIDPYYLGVWLAVGKASSSEIRIQNKEICHALKESSYDISTRETKNIITGNVRILIESQEIEECLKDLNLINNKHIPSEIFCWDKSSRLLLLQGIMDALGGYDKGGMPILATDNELIMEGVKFLVSSLGGETFSSFNKRQKSIFVNMPDDLSCYSISTKRLVSEYRVKKPIKKYITNISTHHAKEMVCFTVDASDSLFAVGLNLTLTHNSEMMINFVPWAMANYPDSNFIYTSYAQSLASLQTQTIRDIMSIPAYKKIFDVEIDPATSAKDDFKTIQGGRVFAAGAGGPITGRGAGIKGCERFGGCVIIDDAHKPEEVHSDTLRERINAWFYNTLQSRLNDKDTPIIAIGQMLHEDDLLANLKSIEKEDGSKEWEVVCLESLDGAGNALYPEMHDVKALLKMKRDSPYVFSSQYQQNPQPSGGGIFKEDWFPVLDKDPHILSTFITADTAETSKTYNDATVFSFWGVYKIEFRGVDTGMYGLHWIDCREIRVEPKDLEDEFYDFYAACMRYRVKPTVAAIEKKSTGVTLCSVLKGTPGLRILDIERSRASGSKTDRFLECQPFVSANRITFTKGSQHADMCITHCKKITANNTHRHDDIADTLQTAIQVTLIEGTLLPHEDNQGADILSAINDRMSHISNLRRGI